MKAFFLSLALLPCSLLALPASAHPLPESPVQAASAQGHPGALFSGEETWTGGEITRIREVGGVIEAFRFKGKNAAGEDVDEWVDAGNLTDEEEAVIRRLKNTGAQDVNIGVKDASPSSGFDHEYTGEIEYTISPPQ